MPQMVPKEVKGLEREWGQWTEGLGCSGQKVTGRHPLLPPEAFLIPTPYYGAITQHVCLYGNVRLAYVYLDSEVRVLASQVELGRACGQEFPESEFEGGPC